MLLSGKSLKHDFIRFVSATMASQVVFSLYSMVDGLMVSIGVNEYAMSAVNLAIPFTNALFSIAVLFAVGSSTLIAIFIAQEKRREANALFSQNFATLLTLGAVITALVLLFLEPFAYLLGADEITLDYVKQYILGIAPFSVCYLVSYNLEVLVKTDGYPRYALFTVIGGCLTNCVLDYIAIFHLDMGVFGAAFATVFSQAVAGIGSLIYIMRHYPELRWNKEEGRISAPHCAKLCAMGLPMGLQCSITAIGSVVLQGAVNGLGSSIVAAQTAGGKAAQTAIAQARVSLFGQDIVELDAHAVQALGDNIADTIVEQVVIEQGTKQELQREIVDLFLVASGVFRVGLRKLLVCLLGN